MGQPPKPTPTTPPTPPRPPARASNAPATPRVYGGMTGEERDESRRRRLRTACAEIIGVRGYAGLTIERMCKVAQVSTRHFYLLYPSKEECFIDTYEHLIRDSFEGALASLAATQGRPLMERLRPAFLAYVSPMVRDVRTARIAFVEIMGVSPRFEERRLALREELAVLIDHEGRAAIGRGEDLRDRDWRIAAIALAGAATSVIYDWIQQADRPSVEYLEEQLSELAAQLLVG